MLSCSHTLGMNLVTFDVLFLNLLYERLLLHPRGRGRMK